LQIKARLLDFGGVSPERAISAHSWRRPLPKGASSSVGAYA